MKKQNVVLKVGIGLMLGLGAMVIAPKAAQASPPCIPDIPSDSETCVNPPQSLCTNTFQTATTNCKDTDGDCTGDTYYKGTTKVSSCKVYPDGLDQPYHFWTCTQTTYVKDGPC